MTGLIEKQLELKHKLKEGLEDKNYSKQELMEFIGSFFCAGYMQGLSEGKWDGDDIYQRGYETGFKAGVISIQTKYDGKIESLEDQLTNAYNDGHEAGYQECLDEQIYR